MTWYVMAPVVKFIQGLPEAGNDYYSDSGSEYDGI
jgi:hypothetical protein